jgi:hypothetical protein
LLCRVRLHLIASAPEVEPAAFQQVARGEFQKNAASDGLAEPGREAAG